MLKGRVFLRVYLALFLFSGIEAVGKNIFLKVLLNERVSPVVEHGLVDAKALFHIKRCNWAKLSELYPYSTSRVLPACTYAMFWKILSMFFFKTQMLSELRLLPAMKALLAIGARTYTSRQRCISGRG